MALAMHVCEQMLLGIAHKWVVYLIVIYRTAFKLELVIFDLPKGLL